MNNPEEGLLHTCERRKMGPTQDIATQLWESGFLMSMQSSFHHSQRFPCNVDTGDTTGSLGLVAPGILKVKPSPADGQLWVGEIRTRRGTEGMSAKDILSF